MSTSRSHLRFGKSASKENEFDTAVAEWMELYDEILAQQDVQPYDRPLRAAVLFARHTVVRVGNQDSEEVIPDDVNLGTLINQRWFGTLVRAIEHWYREAFGAQAMRPPEHILLGAVMYRGTIRLLRVPGTITQPAEVAHQVWIAFPDHLEGGEDVLSWVQPELVRTLPHQWDLATFELQVRNTAGAIRFIASRARNASKGSSELRGLLAGGCKES